MTEELKPLTPEQYEILLSKNERVLWRMTLQQLGVDTDGC